MPVHPKDSVEYRLNEITHGLLQENYGTVLLDKTDSGKYLYFQWTAEFSKEVVSLYQKEHGPISDYDMRTIQASLEARGWRTARLRNARLSIGGSIPSVNKNYKASKGRENAKNGKGILMVSDLSVEDTGLVIEYLEAIQQRKKEPKELPPHLQQYVMKNKSLKDILEVVGNEYDAIQALAEDGVGMDAGISGGKLQKLSVDELLGRVNEVMKKQSVPEREKKKNGKKNGRRKRVVKETKEEAANLRLFGLLSSKELMVGVAKSLQRGEAIMWPVTITLDDGTQISFLTFATMGIVNEKTGNVELSQKICPGQSANHHGSQANNNHTIILDGSTLAWPILGYYFNTNAAKTEAPRLNEEAKASGLYSGVTVPVDGKARIVRRLAETVDEKGVDIKYNHVLLGLPTLPVDSKEISHRPRKKRRTGREDTNRNCMLLSQHRWNNIWLSNMGARGQCDEVNAFLDKHDASCLEEVLLVTGDTEVDIEQMARERGLSPDEIAEWKKEREYADEDNVPQGQCDVDHFLCRFMMICNSPYLCFPMSHTANTCNSIIRRAVGDWCYGLSIFFYEDGS
ncbi:hypothetical protein ACHAWC_004598 [Mediolabrus comicus]